MAAQLEVEILTTVKKVAGAAAILSFAKDVVSAASDAEQAIGAVDAVFKSNANQVKQWASQSAQQLGLAGTDYMQLATLIGTQLKNAGTSMDQLGPKTNELIELGADLSAMFGGTAAQAIEAISSALKGERDPIEKYGVSLNEATIKAQAMAMGLGDLYAAGDPVAKQQATIAAIMDQSADAMGTNAREAETTAGKYQRLIAMWEDAKVTIGASLVPAFESLMNAAVKIIPVITPLLTLFGDLVSALAGLPGPLLAGAAAMALVAKSGIGKAFSNYTSGALSFGGAMKSVGKSLAMGGVLGVATAGLGLLVDKFQDAQQAAEASRQRITELADTMVDSAGKWTDESDAVQRAQVEQSKSFALLIDSGLSYGEAMDHLTGKTKSSAAAAVLWSTAQVANIGSSTAAEEQFLDEAGAASKLAQEKAEHIKLEQQQKAVVDQGVASMNAMISATTGLIAPTAEATQATAEQKAAAAEFNGALQGVVDGIGNYGDALRDAAVDAATTAAENTTLAAKLRETDAAASDADRALQGLQVILDSLSGRNRTAEQATADYNQSLIDMRETAKSATAAGDLNTGALKRWDVAALTARKTGQDAYNTLNEVATSYAGLTASAYSNAAATGTTEDAMRAARKAATEARVTFVDQAQAFGLTRDEAVRLADKLGILEGKKLTDKDFDIIAEDQQAQDTKREVEGWQFDPKTAYIDAETRGVGDAERELDAASAPRSARIDVTVTETVNKVVNTIQNLIPGVTPKAKSTPRALPPVPQSAPQLSPAARGIAPQAASVGGPLAGTYGGPYSSTGGAPVIVVNGALDADSVARQIRGYVVARNRRTGPIAMGTGTRGWFQP